MRLTARLPPMRTLARSLAVALALLSAGCTSEDPAPSVEGNAPPLPGRVTCGNVSAPSFPLAVLNQAGAVDPGGDAPAAVLQALIRESEGLPEEGWIRAAQTADTVLFVARGGGVPWSMATFTLVDGIWNADAHGQCHLQPEVPDGVDLAVFRLAPGVELTPELTEVDLRVSELACNSGQDAHGRIRVLDLIPAVDTVTVILATVPRLGGHDCPGNPETAFTLELPEPLGDRMLLDGSEVPPRDATLCSARICPVP